MSGAASWRSLLYPLVALAVTIVAYAHLFGAYFWSDDFYYLYLLNDDRRLEFVLTPHGGHVQPIRNLVFVLFHALFGVEARWYYAGVFVTHLVNTAMLFVFLRRATRSDGIACAGAVLWGANPLAEGSLGWFSVFGHVMVATFLLAVMLRVQHAAGLAPNARTPRFEPVAWYLALLCGAMSFGTGIGVAAVFPAVLTLWLPGRRWRVVRWLFWTLPAATLALYFQMHRWHYAVAGEADPTMLGVEGLLRQFWWLVPWMTLHLLVFGTAMTAMGPFQLVDYPSWPITAAAVAFGAAALLAGWRADAATRRLLAGALLLSLGAYATIAIGRAPLMHATVRSYAQAATWPRYHYVGAIGVVVAAAAMLRVLRDRVALPTRVAPALLAAWLALTVVWLVRHPYRTVYKIDTRAEVEKMITHVAQQARRSPDAERVVMPNQAFAAGGYFMARTPRFPGLAAAFIAFFPDGRIDGKSVYFVEDRGVIVERVRRRPGTLTDRLLLTPEQAAALGGAVPPPAPSP